MSPKRKSRNQDFAQEVNTGHFDQRINMPEVIVDQSDSSQSSVRPSSVDNQHEKYGDNEEEGAQADQQNTKNFLQIKDFDRIRIAEGSGQPAITPQFNEKISECSGALQSEQASRINSKMF